MNSELLKRIFDILEIELGFAHIATRKNVCVTAYFKRLEKSA